MSFLANLKEGLAGSLCLNPFWLPRTYLGSVTARLFLNDTIFNVIFSFLLAWNLSSSLLSYLNGSSCLVVKLHVIFAFWFPGTFLQVSYPSQMDRHVWQLSFMSFLANLRERLAGSLCLHAFCLPRTCLGSVGARLLLNETIFHVTFCVLVAWNLSPSLLFCPNGSQCLVAKLHVIFCEHKRKICRKSMFACILLA